MSVLKSVEGALRAVDRFQQRHRVLAFPFAVFKKFGDDQGPMQAGLIAYYGFFSLFPLLLVLVSILGIVLADHPGLQERIIDSAVSQFPVIGEQIRTRADVEALRGNAVTIAIGTATSLWAGLGVAGAAQRAMNIVWDIPRAEWPNFVFRKVRAFLMLLLLGTIVLASSFVSGFGSSEAVPTVLLRILTWSVSLVMNLALFTLAYRVLTARDLRWRDVFPGAAVAAALWTALQALGGYYLTRQISGASDIYGTFALVLGLLVWISLGAQVTLLCAEINVVQRGRLWPRSLVQPPLSSGDKAVYAAMVERARMRPEVDVEVTFSDKEDG